MEKSSLIIESKTQGVTQSERDLKNLGKTAERTETATDKIGKSSKRMGTDMVEGIGGGTRAATAGFNAMGGAMQAVQAAMVAMMSIQIIKFFDRLTDKATEFAGGLANIATLMPGQRDLTVQYGTEIRRLSVEMGKTQADLSDATYQVVSAFGVQENTMETLATAAKASKLSAVGRWPLAVCRRLSAVGCRLQRR